MKFHSAVQINPDIMIPARATESAKGEIGLALHEGRVRVGWRHSVALSLMAL